MRILIVSTLKRKVTKDETASRSQIIYRLAKGLAKKGHEVSVLGTADTEIPGVRAIPVAERGWVDQEAVENSFFRDAASLLELSLKLKEVQKDFDLIHNHTYPEFFTSVIEDELEIPLLTTVHSQATEYIDELLSKFKKTKFVGLSKAHISEFKKIKIDFLVYNGIEISDFPFDNKKDDYLLWIGRLSKAKNKGGSFMDPKGVKWAIKLAEESGEKLIITGNVEDMEFYKKEIEPHLSSSIKWYGPVSSKQVLKPSEIANLMGKAKAFLMTVNWDEPFGLVMAEAMACGTPVIGFDRGAVGELVVNGKTGFVVPHGDLEGLKEALKKVHSINPKDCRKRVEDNFTTEKMVQNYEEVYKKLL